MPPWLALIGALPPLAYMLIVDRLDAKRPEPPRTLRMTALIGGLVCVPCATIERLLERVEPTDPLAQVLFHAFVVVAVVEELAKASVLGLYVWRRPEFDERLDGIVYATRAALGFAMVENVSYLFAQPSLTSFVGALVVRAVLSVPGHAIWSGVVGYLAARRRFDGDGPGVRWGLLFAILGHGLFDAALCAAPVALDLQHPFVGATLFVMPFVEVAAGLWLLRRLARRALAADDLAEARLSGEGLRVDVK